MSIADVAALLFGEPNKALSRRDELRFGRKGSLSVDVARNLFYDHDAKLGGDPYALIMHVNRCDFRDALALVVGERVIARHEAPPPAAKPSDAERTRRALALWNDARDPVGSLAERYLASRPVALPRDPARVLRFHPACPFGEGERHPCMIALVRSIATGEPAAVHRTALTPDGAKIGRKVIGPAGGGAIMLGDDQEVETGLALAEGIETALSIIGDGEALPMWVLPAGQLRSFPVLAGLELLTVYADNDDAGLSAADAVARRYADAGRYTIIEVPTAGGADFNDILGKL